MRCWRRTAAPRPRVRGAMDVFGAAADVTLVPLYGAKGCSAGSAGARTRSSGSPAISCVCCASMPLAPTGSTSRCMAPWVPRVSSIPEGYLLEEARRILGTGRADRGVARPAWHPHCAHAAQPGCGGGLPHLSARGFRRYRRARRAPAAAHPGRGRAAGDGAGQGAGAGAGPRADHRRRRLWRHHPPGPGDGARWRPGGGDADRQSVHRRARAM